MISATFEGAFDNRGIAYPLKGQFERAIQDFDQGIRSHELLPPRQRVQQQRAICTGDR